MVTEAWDTVCRKQVAAINLRSMSGYFYNTVLSDIRTIMNKITWFMTKRKHVYIIDIKDVGMTELEGHLRWKKHHEVAYFNMIRCIQMTSNDSLR